jgi:hypothetical protein
VPSDKPIEAKMSHPVLGPAVAIYDDRSRTRLRLLFEIAMVPLGIFGIFLGMGDLAAGNTLLGVGQISGAIIVALYGTRSALIDVRRMRSPIRLVIARDGFELVPGGSPISWAEIASVGDPRNPAGDPRTLRAQLDDPSGYAGREALSPFDRIMIRINRGDLNLGSGLAMPIVKVEDLMRKQLAEFRRLESSPASEHAHIPARPRGRRARPARRH